MAAWPLAAALLAVAPTGQTSQTIPDRYVGVWEEAGHSCSGQAGEHRVVLTETQIITRGVEHMVKSVTIDGFDITILSLDRWREPPVPAISKFRMIGTDELLEINFFWRPPEGVGLAPREPAILRSFHRCPVTAETTP